MTSRLRPKNLYVDGGLWLKKIALRPPRLCGESYCPAVFVEIK
jgi:hypothetical protein